MRLSHESCFKQGPKILQTFKINLSIYLITCLTRHFITQIKLHSSSKIVGLHTKLYRVSQEECARLREGVPYVKVYRYNPKHLYSKLNGYGDNGQRSLKI